MSPTELLLRDPLGERALSAAAFPVSVAGPPPSAPSPGAGTGEPAPWVAGVWEQQTRAARLVGLPGRGIMPQGEHPLRSLRPVRAFPG
mgnify:CR=1 FL=1